MNRRETLGLLGAALGAPAASRAANLTTQRAAPQLDKLLTHIRIRVHPDGRPVYFAYEGTAYGQRSGQRTVPLMHIVGASTSTSVKQTDGSWLYTQREAGWMCDLASQEVLQTWRNPFNDRVLSPRHYNSRQTLKMNDTGVAPVAASLPAGLEFHGAITEPVVIADDVWSCEELLVRVPSATPGGAAQVQTSLATLHAKLADLSRTANAWIPATFAYQTLQSWPAWMEMPADMPGVISWRLLGRKCATIAEIPEALRQRIQTQHPEVFKW